DRTIRLWTTDPSPRLESVAHPKEVVRRLGWSADGAWLATSTGEGRLSVRDADGGIVWRWSGRAPVAAWAWAPEEPSLLVAGPDGGAYLWRPSGSGGSAIAALGGVSVVAASWAPDGRRCVLATADRRLVVVRFPAESALHVGRPWTAKLV